MLKERDFNEKQVWSFIHTTIHNAAVDLRRKEKYRMDIDIADAMGKHCVHQQDIDLKNICRALVPAIRESLNPVHQRVFDDYFITGYKYIEVAERNNIKIDTIKAIIFRIREKANKNYGHLLAAIN